MNISTDVLNWLALQIFQITLELRQVFILKQVELRVKTQKQRFQYLVNQVFLDSFEYLLVETLCSLLVVRISYLYQSFSFSAKVFVQTALAVRLEGFEPFLNKIKSFSKNLIAAKFGYDLPLVR